MPNATRYDTQFRSYSIHTSDGKLYNLDATSSFQMRDSAKSTDSRVESGDIISDHVSRDNTLFTLSGVISDIKLPFLKDAYSPEEFIRRTKELMVNGEPFNFFATSKVFDVNNVFFQNCVLVDRTISQTTSRGIANGGRTHAYSASLTIKQIQIGSRATREPAYSLNIRDDVVNETISPKAVRQISASEEVEYRRILGNDILLVPEA